MRGALLQHDVRAGLAGLHLGGIVILVDGREIADGDELQGGVDLPHVFGDLIVLQDIVLHLHEPELPGSEHLVADAPVFHPVRLLVAVLDAPAPANGIGATVGILDPLGGGIGVAEARVGGDHRLGADLAAEDHELVGAEIVVLDAGPGRVLAGRAAVTVPDAVAPVVAAHEVATRPAVDSAVELLQERERVAAHAFEIVGRHDRRRPEQHIAAEHAEFEQGAPGSPK